MKKRLPRGTSKKPKKLFRKIIHSSLFKAFLVTIAAGHLLLCFAITASRFNATDPEPPVQDIDIELTRKFEAFTVHVETGLFIRSFSYFDILENRFVADMIVWFLFNPTEITLNTIDKFSFENGKIVKKSQPDIKMMDDKTFVKYNVIVELQTNLQYHRFPLEDHLVSVVLTNHFVTPYEVLFEVLSTDFVTSPTIFIPNWRIKNLKTNFGIDESILNQIDVTKKIAYPKAVFTVELVKAGLRKAFIIFTPIFIIFFFALFSFFLTLGNLYGKTALSVAALTALLGYRFVIEQLMPKVGYLTTTDYIYIILLTFSFIIFIFNLLLVRSYNVAKQMQGDTKALMDRYRFIKDIVFISITVLSTIILCFAIVW